MSSFKGQVYIICFDQPYLNKGCNKWNKHYIGFTTFLDMRIAHHRNGTGSKYLKAMNDAGITYIVSRVFNHVDRDFERKLKKLRNVKFFCPRCNEKARKPKFYTEPVKIQRRSYRVMTVNGVTVIYDVIINRVTLIDRLSKRFRVGETFVLDSKFYTRVNKRTHKKYFDVQETAQPIEQKEVEVIKDLVPTNSFRIREYLINSINKKKEEQAEFQPAREIQYDEDIPY